MIIHFLFNLHDNLIKMGLSSKGCKIILFLLLSKANLKTRKEIMINLNPFRVIYKGNLGKGSQRDG